ncbi:urease accessory protein UreF [Azospirillum thermophilum]|uniref:Urease accessory protein UreF n=1 Tax=Azospirillum thermophilum TaxID=2202148 RepID=A0A2S2CTY2_9PROT|nr:urease accessory UreF family protein [Azospirillum thermophilum]AWK87983.1 urease accessory protein UreF [Azospirillum thermophilum]
MTITTEPAPSHRDSAAGSPAPLPGDGREHGTVSAQALTKLLAWLSPSFPVGGFTYSHGIEAAVEQGLATDRASLIRWLDGILRHGAGRTDGMLFAAAHRAVLAGDEAAFAWAVERADVLRATAETALESRAQGQAFLTAVRAAWPLAGLERWDAVLAATGRPPAYAVAVALAAALLGVAEGPALAAYLHAFAANLVSAGVRLVPLGQTDGQRALAALDPVVHRAARAALAAPPDDLGGRAMAVDWTSMIHETQYTRLFRS